MKKLIGALLNIFLIILFFLCTDYLSGQVYLEENFDYPSGENLTSHNWIAHDASGTNPITVNPAGLSYSGYISSGIGNAALLDGPTGEDDNRTFTEQISGSIYVSFLANISSASTSGDYFLHFMPTNAASNRGRVFVKRNTSNMLSFGLSKSQTASAALWTGYIYSLNMTYLLILKYTIVDGIDNDQTYLYIFESPTVPTTEPGSPNIGPDVIGTDAANIGSIALRQGSTSSPIIIIDGIRVGSTWSDTSLPVELTSFSASAGDRRVTLRWSTASEIENAGFAILRSIEKENGYREIDSYLSNNELRGAGNSSQTQNYSYTDASVTNDLTYWYKLVDVDVNGIRTEHGPISATPQAALVDQPEDGSVPQNFYLKNYPNPFNPNTIIVFDLSSIKEDAVDVRLVIYDMLGQPVKTLVNGNLTTTSHTLQWDGRNELNQQLPSGVYFCQLATAQIKLTQKMMLMR